MIQTHTGPAVHAGGLWKLRSAEPLQYQDLCGPAAPGAGVTSHDHRGASQVSAIGMGSLVLRLPLALTPQGMARGFVCPPQATQLLGGRGELGADTPQRRQRMPGPLELGP